MNEKIQAVAVVLLSAIVIMIPVTLLMKTVELLSNTSQDNNEQVIIYQDRNDVCDYLKPVLRFNAVAESKGLEPIVVSVDCENVLPLE